MKFTLSPMSYGGVKHQTHESIVKELSESNHAWRLLPHPGDAAVDRARGIVATKFIASNSDVLCMVDHDVGWQTGDLSYIAEEAFKRKAIVGGLVSKRAIGQGFGGRFGDGKPHEYGSYEVVKLPENGYVGGAFIAIHRDALLAIGTRMKLPLTRTKFIPFFMPILVEGKNETEYLSEDWAFCHRAHLSGVSVYVAMHPIVTHYGDFGYTVLHHGALNV